MSVRVIARDAHASTLLTLWHNEECRCIGSLATGDFLTLYGVQYSGLVGTMHHLTMLTGTVAIPSDIADRRTRLQLHQVQHIIPELPVWPETEEMELLLDEAELAAFDDPSLGSTDRILALTAQAIWVLAHLRAWAARQHDGPVIDPCLEISQYQTRILQQRQDSWITVPMTLGGDLSLCGPDGPCPWKISGPTRVGEVLDVERAFLGPGTKAQILEDSRVLPTFAMLHPLPAGPCYILQVRAKKARCLSPTPDEPTVAVKRRLFHDDPDHCHATSCGASELLSESPGQSDWRICTDTALWCCLRQAARDIPDFPVVVLPPTIAATLLDYPDISPRPGTCDHSAEALPEGHRILVPFAASGHWTLLAIRVVAQAAQVIVFDGVPGRNTIAARQLVTTLTRLGGCTVQSFLETTVWPQTSPGSCGVLALAHALYWLSEDADRDHLRRAESLLAELPPLPYSLAGLGGLSAEQEKELKGILISKGVPGEDVDSRLQAAVAKLGSGPLAQTLSQKNVWQALKALGSRPGTLFKWVLPAELQAHIEQRAQTRYGTEVARPKAKKQKGSRSMLSAPLHIDPTSLQLVPGSFVAKSGSPLGQLSFAEVQAGVTGICFCTTAQVAPFLAQAKNLSVDALALITTAVLDIDSQESLRVSHLRFPAVYSPTQEAILVTGSMVQLGDDEVELASATSVEVDNLPTTVVRLSLFKDECKIPWDRLAEAPVRALLQHVPEFQVCRKQTCDRACLCFHAAVDEEVEHLFLDVWARQWCRVSGGKVKAEAAELFQVFIRVPASALPHMFCTSQPGLYVEPRASDGSGPHGSWAVVWLPGASAAQAQHALKTTEKALSLARIGHKYGLRTKEADEQTVFEALRPQHQFLKVRVTAHYRLHPLPHGFQRHALVQQLMQWNWNGKPLQPDKGDALGSAWLIGASSEPPLQALPLGPGFVLATKVKDVGAPKSNPTTICASNRTRKALLLDDDHDEAPDPWAEGRDPWSAARQPPPAVSSSSTEAVTKIAQVEAGLRHDLQELVQRKFDEREAAGPPPGLSDQDKRLHALETTVSEMKHQNLNPGSKEQKTELGSLHETGRVMIAQHYNAASTLTVATVYGYPRGPTWPDAQSRTDLMLGALTREVVLGARGFRVICGDFNHDAASLQQCQLWQAHGWVEVQDFAQHRWGIPPKPTCKNATRRDYLWLSPEAVAFLSQVRVTDVFQEHATVIAGFSLPGDSVPETIWPVPAELCWSEVDIDAWHRLGDHRPAPCSDPDKWFAHFSKAVEHSLDGFLPGFPNKGLPSNCFGRGARLHPQQGLQQARPPRASRQGEVSMLHDGLGAEVQRWFKQLRRLQSLVHALRAASRTPFALDYQLGLWRSILGARGFRHGFATWWLTRPVQLAGCPPCLPRRLPDASTAQALYFDFRSNYRSLEAWHIRRRATVLDAKYDKSLAQVYKELRDPAPEQVDSLQITREYAILATAPSGFQVHVEKPLDLRGTSTWTVDGVSVEISSCDSDVCTFVKPLDFTGQELEQVQVFSSTADIFSEFTSLWAPRWQQHAHTSATDWQRFLDFATAFLPRHDFEIPDISLSMWDRALRRFKPRCARGPDGWARDDLLHLPKERTIELLGMLRSIELDRRPWPKQLLLGFVCMLNKHNGREDANGFRPICLYSVIYRTWSGIRARQVLAALRRVIPDGLLGFIPGKEAMELWYSVQLEIELCCQTGGTLLGLSTDISKCFNNLPRLPLLAMAAHVGLPWRLLGPWSDFLQRTVRRFLVRGQVSPPIASTSGFPEGCPLSPVAMVLANWSYHVYMQAFCPQVRSLSYVDNFACTTCAPARLAQAYSSVQCFMDMLSLPLDFEKTFIWATEARARKAIACFGPPVREAARELGGIMSFGPRIRNAALKARCLNLGPIWQSLRRSRAPACLKLLALPAKVWPRALHGIAAVPLAEAQLSHLRAAATSALKIRPGGSSSMLRLSIADPPTADPGFYQLWTCVRDLRRMARRLPNFMHHWRLYHATLSGQRLHGPFTKLLEVLSQIGWSVHVPPTVLDHEGLAHNLVRTPLALLRRLLLHGWLQFVARAHVHRAAMSDLKGLDPALLAADITRMTALDVARYASVRSGAFLFGHQHAHFDARQDGLCKHCGVPDTVEHKIRLCGQHQSVRQEHQWVCDQWDSLPTSLTHHLLPSANPHLPKLRVMLHEIADTTGVFFFSGSGDCWQHLFSDGSCLEFAHPDLALAGWGLIHADGGQAIACGNLPGILQTAPRAELTALTAAIRWALATRLPVILWTDALNVANGVAALQNGGSLEAAADSDLWDNIASLLEQLDATRFLVRHTPSHLDPSLTEDAFEDWLAKNNNHADILAGQANRNRPQLLVEAHGLAVEYHNSVLQALRALRSIFFGIADRKTDDRIHFAVDEEQADDTVAPPSGSVPKLVNLEDALPLNWRNIVGEAALGMPHSFVIELCDFLHKSDLEATVAYKCSWLELVFVLHVSGVNPYPSCDTSGKWVETKSLSFPPPAPTETHERLGRIQARKEALHSYVENARLLGKVKASSDTKWGDSEAFFREHMAQEGVARELRRIRINLQGTIAAEGSDGSPECSTLLEEAMAFQEAFSRRLEDKQLCRIDSSRDVDSTMVGDRSDQETVDGTISPSVPSPRIEATVADEEQETEELQCVVVRGTFLEVLDDGQCMMQRYRKMRKEGKDKKGDMAAEIKGLVGGGTSAREIKMSLEEEKAGAERYQRIVEMAVPKGKEVSIKDTPILTDPGVAAQSAGAAAAASAEPATGGSILTSGAEIGSEQAPAPDPKPDAAEKEMAAPKGILKQSGSAKTDFASKAGTQDPEVYEPGRYSEEQESTRGYAGDTEEAPQMQPMPVEEERLQKKVARPRESAEASCKTTVMLRNLPNNYTRDMLLELLDERGMEGRYDFVRPGLHLVA
ncbi:ML5 [Symbiodinium sp. KB8]|nr:ML5 [Symbiodinium sp. KB8]